MSKLVEKINQDLKQAMRDKQADLLSTLRLLNAAILNKEITLRRGGQAELNDEQVLEVIASEIKKRQDSIEAYLAGNRQDLADKEKKEMEILQKYLPEQLSDEELEKIVKEIISGMGEITEKDFGKIMGAVMAKVKGKVEGGRVTEMVKMMLAK